MSLAAKKGHHCSAKHLQPLVQQHCLAPTTQNQYFLERKASLEKLSSDLGRGHSQDMGNTSVRSSTHCLFICCKLPLVFSLVQVFLPSICLRQSAHGGKDVYSRRVHCPPFGLRLYQLLGLYLKGSLLTRRKQTERCTSEAVFFP